MARSNRLARMLASEALSRWDIARTAGRVPDLSGRSLGKRLATQLHWPLGDGTKEDIRRALPRAKALIERGDVDGHGPENVVLVNVLYYDDNTGYEARLQDGAVFGWQDVQHYLAGVGNFKTGYAVPTKQERKVWGLHIALSKSDPLIEADVQVRYNRLNGTVSHGIDRVDRSQRNMSSEAREALAFARKKTALCVAGSQLLLPAVLDDAEEDGE